MKEAATVLLRLYKGIVSPFLPVSCRYVPSCSEYTAEAVALHGFFYGAALGLWRLLRCNPFTHGGYDPVPRKRNQNSDHRTVT
jgi:putative membrane protein insertion efficiency factor